MRPAEAEPTARALVVDDDPAVRLLVAEILGADGHEVLDAESGSEAIARFEQSTPDLVILDVLMPGMDGFATCRALRERPGGGDVPILMLTGRDDDEAVHEAFLAGATDFAAKPIHAPLLRHRVQFMLRARKILDELKASRSSLADAQRIASLGSFEIDATSRSVCWSAEARRLLGSPESDGETSLEKFLEHVHRRIATRSRCRWSRPASRATRWSWNIGCFTPMERSRPFACTPRRSPGRRGPRKRMSGTVQDVTSRRQSEDRIRFLNYYDNLTGLPNRVLFNEALQQALARAKRDNRVLAAMFLDLDHFKRINDTLGHRAGDLLLRIVGGRLRDVVRGTDTVARDDGTNRGSVARLGGDEFILFLTDLRRAEDAARVASRMLEVLQAPVHLDAGEVYVSASIGIGLFPQDGANIEELLQERRRRPLPRQGRGPEQLPVLHPVDECRRVPAPGARGKPPPRDRAPRVRAALPAEGLGARGPDGRSRGPRPLAPPRSRPRHARPVHPGRRGERPDHRAGEMGTARGLRADRALARGGSRAGWGCGEPPGQQFRRGDLLRTVDEILSETGITSDMIELEITETVLMENAAETEKILAELRCVA